MRSQPSSVSSYRLPRFFEAAAFFVFIRVLHDEGTMTYSDQERNLTGAEQTIRQTGPSAVTDPQGPRTGTARVLRGGSWIYDSYYCRASNRFVNIPSLDSFNIGFRAARTP